ncbi:transposable element Tc1 transposase [Caerostris darwini]|uniref:Transposable element Tc1 transposase n=1 Tax=Caerostris darwini TaxID=1538125 RepID=A0AAV4R1Z9_9ARAC|nr:transposable element Tc1 transposase [Caerostris darwini]
MPRSSELSDFEKGIIIGYHKCGRSLRDISSDLKYPNLTVAYVIKKWKVSGDCRNVPLVGRPTKLGDRDRRVLTKEIRKNRTQPKALIREEFQQASGSIVSMNTCMKHICMVFMVVLVLQCKSNRPARSKAVSHSLSYDFFYPWTFSKVPPDFLNWDDELAISPRTHQIADGRQVDLRVIPVSAMVCRQCDSP